MRRKWVWFSALFLVVVVMTGVQFLAAPTGGLGAGDIGPILLSESHRTLGTILVNVNRSRALAALDRAWQRGVNAPRNYVLSWLGILNSPKDVYPWSRTDRMGWAGLARDVLILAIGTFAIYGLTLYLVFVAIQKERPKK